MRNLILFVCIFLSVYSFSQNRQRYQYKQPQAVYTPQSTTTYQSYNIQSILQARYDENIIVVQNYINDLFEEIEYLRTSSENKNKIRTRLKKVINYLNQQTLDYSSSSQTNKVLNYIKKSYDEILFDEY